MAMLEVKDLHVHYGVIEALKGVSMSVNEGQIVALIGSNGAGKTTLLQSISGIKKKTSGEVMFLSDNITSASPKKIVSEGLTQVPEGRRVFTGLSVYENLMMGAFLRRDKQGIEEDLQKVYAQFPILEQRKNQDASTLSGGEQQMLAIGRALMGNPRLLLLDEPSMGLSPLMTQQVFDVLAELKAGGMTILLVEQNAYEALTISDRAYIMESGNITLEGRSSELIDDPRVKDAYLGGDL